MKRRAKKTGIILCPDDPRWANGEPLFASFAALCNAVGHTCKLCGKPTAEHSIIIREDKDEA